LQGNYSVEKLVTPFEPPPRPRPVARAKHSVSLVEDVPERDSLEIFASVFSFGHGQIAMMPAPRGACHRHFFTALTKQ
jgi:hypothetical protein